MLIRITNSLTDPKLWLALLTVLIGSIQVESQGTLTLADAPEFERYQPLGQRDTTSDAPSSLIIHAFLDGVPWMERLRFSINGTNAWFQTFTAIPNIPPGRHSIRLISGVPQNATLSNFNDSGSNTIEIVSGTTNVVTASFTSIKQSAGISLLDRLNWRNPLPHGYSFYRALYTNDTLCAVGPDVALWSTNSVDWQIHDTKGHGEFQDLIFVDGIYYAVGTKNGQFCVATTKNGADWSSIVLDSKPHYESRLFGITYGNGMFVAAGGETSGVSISREPLNYVRTATGPDPTDNRGVIFTSRDGRTWIRRESGTEFWLYSVTFANNQFTAVESVVIGPP